MARRSAAGSIKERAVLLDSIRTQLDSLSKSERKVALAVLAAPSATVSQNINALARSAQVSAPTIGIGASPDCDGQVLVTDDMLGMFERTPRFVKRYDDLASRIGAAAASYADEVRSRAFPTADQTYRPKS